MDKDLDLEKFSRELQEQILTQIRKRYTAQVIENWQNPQNFISMADPDGYARVSGSCGDTMEMFIRVKKDVLTDCSFQTDGCGTTIACGSVATRLAKNKSFTEALALANAEEILKELSGLPEEDIHCAQLAAETLRRALADYLYQEKNPWKKAYRKR